MATSRLAIGSLLETVSSAAGAITSIFNTTGKSIGMLDAFVTKASDEQTLRHRADKDQFIFRLISEASQEKANDDMKIKAFCDKSEDHKASFEKAFNHFHGLFAKELGHKDNTTETSE